MTSSQPVLRRYTSKDKKDVVHLLRLNTPKFFNEIEEKELLIYLENHLEDYFVVDLAGSIIGAGGINYFPEVNEARISWDLIHPEHQNKGVGKQLLIHRLEKIQSQTQIKKVVVRTSQLVVGFYTKMGFITEYVKKDYWAPGLDLHFMSMEIPLGSPNWKDI
ncbi:MAG TPA: GNAT family N-acetyltransferase [Gillisia sp.]|nr:GNAT family N-acetyltransferase [Gillisia sp.]